jgi:hypothetical protein
MTDLFTAMRVGLTNEARVSRDARTRYQEFHNENPWVMSHLADLALQLKRRGVRRYGIAPLFEVLRYQHTLRTNDPNSVFRLNNNYRAYYAREIMDRYPELDGFFETRTSQADDR